MRLIIKARLVDGESDPVEEGDGVLAVVERPDLSLAELGLTLAEGRSLLAKVQTELISQQVQRWLAGQTHCENCGAALRHKDSRSTVLRTVYGKVAAVVVRVSSDCADGAACGAPLVESANQTRHAGAGIPSGEVGSSSALPAGDEHAQGSATAGQGHLVHRHPESDS
jgi:hypothetical protein